ncbi:MAG: hypothetical protein JXJ04_25355 [Spirochaetales bacterium]|nr:hypothetical protein [Spirochaetales bacterium]
MDDKKIVPKKDAVKQDAWLESPCSVCSKAPCCSFLPLTYMRLENRTDFMNLALLACYDNIILGFKKSGEWSVYYNKTCKFLNPVTSMCTIHGSASQSYICKTYDAHHCWYKPIFVDREIEDFIFIDFHRLLSLEKYMDFIHKGFDNNELDWRSLIGHVLTIPLATKSAVKEKRIGYEPPLLPFKKNLSENILFFPPYEKPGRDGHFDLLTFRLGFPGVYLALADNAWAFMIRTTLNKQLFKQLTSEYFPTLHPRNGCYSFFQLNKERSLFSEIGEKLVILQLHHIQLIKTLTKYDAFGNIKRLPTTRELIDAIRAGAPIKPDKAA